MQQIDIRSFIHPFTNSLYFDIRSDAGKITMHSACMPTYWVAKKVSHYKIIKKSFKKPANYIRFNLQIKVSVKHYNIIRWYSILSANHDLIFDVSNYA